MIPCSLARLWIVFCGTLYPAYASYKAVKTKDVTAYVQWMIYWIVFALFTCVETFTDIFFAFWFPFYYEVKIAIVFWLLSSGSNIVYRKFVMPQLALREQDIDEFLENSKGQGCQIILDVGSRLATYFSQLLVQTIAKARNQEFAPNR